VALAENVAEGASLKGADKSFNANAVASTH